MKMTKKQVKEWLNFEGVTDITDWSCERINELRKKEEWFNEVGYSSGVYGVSGCVLQGHKTLNFYVIKTRSSALFCVM